MISLMNLTVDMIVDGLSYIELMLIWNSDVDCTGICVRILMLIVYLSASFIWFIWSKQSVFRSGRYSGCSSCSVNTWKLRKI